MITRVSMAFLATALLCIGASGAVAAVPGSGSASEAYSAAGLYNQANAAARAGQLGEAVLDYERAALLAPRDSDIRANLAQVRARAGLATPGNWLTQHARIAEPNAMFWLASLGIVLTGASLLARRFGKTLKQPLAGVALVGLALTLAGVTDAIATAATLNEAVVMQASAARAAPIPAADSLFVVPQAEVVRRIEDHGDYTLVRDAQNREGWLPRSSVRSIIPPEASR